MNLDNVEDLYPLSPVQQGMLFHSLAASNAGVYIGQYTCHLQGSLNAELLRQAWQQVLERHTVLRTMFVWELDDPLQLVRRQVELPWFAEDWRDRPDSETALKTYLTSDRARGFALDVAPLMRVALIRLTDNTYVLVWTCHHLILDGWSLPKVWDEILALYTALKSDRLLDLPAPKPYRDYIAWLQERDWTPARQFWSQLLDGFTEPTPLPGERPNSNRAHSGIPLRSRHLSSELLTSLQEFSRRHRLTLSTLINAAWALLLNRYSGEDDVVFGLVVSGRLANITDIESRVGVFVNTLPMRVAIAASTQLIPWLQALQERVLEARQYEATPLSDIQNWCNLPAGESLYDSLVVFKNLPATPTDKACGLSISDIDTRVQSNYPLVLLVLPGETFELRAIFDPKKFPEDAIDRILGQFETVLRGFVEIPQATLADIPLLPATERQRLLHDWNQTQRPLPEARCIHHFIEAQADRVPDAMAVAFEQSSLTYSELNQLTNQLARHLQTLGVTENTRVGICLERSLEAIVAIVAALKAGAAYVPLDPAYPRERLTFMVEDAEVTVVVTQHAWLDSFPSDRRQILCLDDDAEAIAQTSRTPLPNRSASPHAEAYVIYTSGSTGQPKGVAVSHRNLVHSTLARFEAYPDTVRSFLLLSSFSFDSSVAGIFWTLCQGGSLVLPRQGMEQNLLHLAGLIERHEISHTLCLPALYALLISSVNKAQLQSLQVAIVAGEACPRSLPQQHYSVLPQTKLYNEYGPTEATVWCSVCEIPRDTEAYSEASVPIGKPIPNTQLYVLDKTLRPVPIGAPGELYVGGTGVTAGYLNRPDPTRERFMADPFSDSPNAQLYKTGDLACRLADGNLELLGRSDRQVKIRGFRIELDELEDQLNRHEWVDRAVAIAREDSPGQKSLVAYIVSAETLNVRGLKSYLKQRLPHYMVPSAIVPLDALPLTPNGKVDRKALPAPQIQQDESAIAPARNELERQLVSIWESLLNVQPIGIEDNFFELGGHSLLAIRLLTAMEQEIGITFPINQLFERSTIASISEAIAKQTTPDPAPCIVPLKPGNPEKPLFLIHAIGSSLLFYKPLIAQLKTERSIYGIQSLFLKEPDSPVNTVADLAKCYINQIETVCPQGSYAVAGSSFGGLVAYEIARQMELQGRDIDALILFDRAAPGHFRPLSSAKRYQKHFQRMLEKGPNYLLSKLERRLAANPPQSGKNITTIQEDWQEELEHFNNNDPTENIVRRQSFMGDAYIPSHYPGCMSLIRSEEIREDCEVIGEDMGWSDYARGGVRVSSIPGKHMSIFKPPNVEGLATQIDSILQEAGDRDPRNDAAMTSLR